MFKERLISLSLFVFELPCKLNFFLSRCLQNYKEDRFFFIKVDQNLPPNPARDFANRNLSGA